MSSMDHAAFAPASGIQELNFDEIETVNGGGAGVAIAVGVIVVGLLAIGYIGEHNRDNEAAKESE